MVSSINSQRPHLCPPYLLEDERGQGLPSKFELPTKERKHWSTDILVKWNGCFAS